MNKKSIQKLNSFLSSLGILAIFALGILSIPFQAHADQAGVVTPYGATRYNNVPVNNGYNTYTGPAPVYTAPVDTSTSVNTTDNTTGEVQGASTTRTTTTTVKNTDTDTENDSNLSANAVSAHSGFLPSGLLQWIFFAILILLIVILVRKILGADKKYHSTPLKHA